MQLLKFVKGLTFWNRKLHIHLGLFLLLFIWLFSLSGLLLNHGEWRIASFWDERKETKTVTPIKLPKKIDSNDITRVIMSQLELAGEVSDVKMWPDSVHFRVSKPGKVRDIEVNFLTRLCTKKELKYNFAGKIRTLHTFNGVNKNDPDTPSNWLITRVWRLSMDGIAIGLLLLCVSGWIMWYKVRERFRWGMDNPSIRLYCSRLLHCLFTPDIMLYRLQSGLLALVLEMHASLNQFAAKFAAKKAKVFQLAKARLLCKRQSEHMTHAEYFVLSDDEKADLLEREGVEVARVKEDGIDHILMQLHSFYIEGQFDATGELIRILSYPADTTKLDRYL